MDLETEPADFIAALFLGGVECIRARGEVRGEYPEALRPLWNGVDVNPLRGRPLSLLDDRHIAVVRHRQELKAPPITRRRACG